MPDPEVIRGFAAWVRSRKEVFPDEPEVAMLADHLEESGQDALAHYVRSGKPRFFLAQNPGVVHIFTNGQPNYDAMMELFRLLNPGIRVTQ